MPQDNTTRNIKREKILSRRAKHLKNFLNAHSLLCSENAREHAAVYKAVQKELPTHSFIEKWHATRFANAIWDLQRTQRLAAGIVQGAQIDAIVELLGKFGKELDKKKQTAVDYFVGSDDDQRRARRTLEKLGITPDMIEARALELKLPTILAFEKMCMHNEQTIEKLEKRQKKLARAKKGKKKIKDSNGRLKDERADLKLVSPRSKDSWGDKD